MVTIGTRQGFLLCSYTGYAILFGRKFLYVVIIISIIKNQLAVHLINRRYYNG